MNIILGNTYLLKSFKMVVMITILIAFCSVCVSGQGSLPEHEVKAAFIYNFSKFVDWPSNAFPSSDSPLAIGVIGDSSLKNTLQRIVSNENINGRSIVVSQAKNDENLKRYHILFVGKSELNKTSGILSSVRGSSVLTIGETGEFLRSGGVINFFLENNKVRFEINPNAAQRNSLKISSKLLRLAKISNG
jgi:hypothetical protein